MNRAALVAAGVVAVAAVVVGVVVVGGDDETDPATEPVAEEQERPAVDDTARYVLPPGNYGGVPTGENSLDQLPLYDGLTPLRGDVSREDIDEHYLPFDFTPIEPTTVEDTGRPGLELVYDAYGVPHITGETREDVAFGAGWVTARDRGLLIQLARGPARAAVADVPGLNAFGLVTSARTFVPSAAAEALVDEQWELVLETYGEEGEEILADAEAGAAGANAYFESQGVEMEPLTANDVIATAAFIGSIFGAGGGGEVDNALLLAQLQAELGEEEGAEAWNDVMFTLDPEAPTTIDEEFDYGPLTGGEVVGSVVLDEGSLVATDPVEAQAGEDDEAAAGLVDAAGAPPRREASNFLLVHPDRSATGATQAVQGPQLGYYYPEIVQQVHLSGPGFEAQGAAVPGLTMYILIGRTADYSWSLTSAGHDNQDVFAEELCEPDGSTPTRASQHYVFEGECTPMEVFDAGTLDGAPVRYPVTEHGPVIGTATVDGAPYALSRQRSTFGRDGLNLKALKDMTEGEATTAEDFYDIADQFEFTFNWSYASRDDVAFFSSGRLPERAEGLDRRLPTLGTGEYEWQGFLDRDEHPHAAGGRDGLVLNWNNQSAPGFLHGDGDAYGPVHRVELFDQWPEETELTDVVGVMNRAATEDARSLVWPLISEVLAGGEAPTELDAEVVALLDDWVARDAPRLDADDDGDYDEAGPAVMDAVFEPLARATVEPVFGDLVQLIDDTRGLGGTVGQSIVDKDLRTLLGQDVEGPLALSYCGAGDLATCQEDLWAAFSEVVAGLEAELGPDPEAWLVEADRTGFVPGLIPDDMRTTNRPTYQQVLELGPR
jgi:acyl-homoserine lactone acylase PvdQ